MTAPRTPEESIKEQIQALSRKPFRDLVVTALASSPTQGAIEALAEKHPDRYGQYLAIVARLGGFNERLEVEGSLTTTISTLSDAELAARVAAFNSPSVCQTDEHDDNTNDTNALEA